MPYTTQLVPARDDRRQRLAGILMGRGLNPQITGTGLAGAVQGLAGLAQAYVGRRIAEETEAEQEARQEATRAQLAEIMGSFSDGQGGAGGAGIGDPRILDLAMALDPSGGRAFDYVTRAPQQDPLTKVWNPETGLMEYTRQSQAYGQAAAAPATPQPNKTRTVRRGNLTVTEEFDPASRTWNVIGEGPAFAPRQGDGGPTQPQVANNAEIDAARRMLEGVTAEDIKRNVPTSATGRPNYDYSTQLDRLVATATQRKVGVDDPEFEQVWSRLYGTGGSTDPGAPEQSVTTGDGVSGTFSGQFHEDGRPIYITPDGRPFVMGD